MNAFFQAVLRTCSPEAPRAATIAAGPRIAPAERTNVLRLMLVMLSSRVDVSASKVCPVAADCTPPVDDHPQSGPDPVNGGTLFLGRETTRPARSLKGSAAGRFLIQAHGMTRAPVINRTPS